MTEARKPQFGRTREEKLRIAAECRKYDIVETCKKHGIYTASYYDRVQRFALDDARGAYLEASK
jgi:transposase-like protein